MIRTTIYAAVLSQLKLLKQSPYNLEIPKIEFGLDNAENEPAQPCIYLTPAKENSVYTRGFPIKWEVEAEIYVYTKKTGNKTGVENLLPVMDAIDSVLSPQTNAAPGAYANTLGGLVSSCAIYGTVEIFGGYLGDQTIARIPIKIVTAG